MTSAIMVDIETLATTNDAAIIAIGAVAFNAVDFTDEIEILIDARFAPGYRDPRTVTEFWLNRDEVSEAVYDRMFSGDYKPWEAIMAFNAFCAANTFKQAWAYPPQFDFVIMRHLWYTYGMDFPIHYTKERDMRTLAKLAKKKRINYSSAYEGIEKHSAISDARAQAKAIQIINRELF